MNPEDVKALLPPSVVENLLGPASDAIGKTLGGVLYGIFQWPIKYGIVKKAEFDDLARKTSKKYQEIPQQNRSDAKAGLALKALEESKYQLNEEELREMFAQLIASSFDNRINNIISPRFATVLSQLSGTDAKFFKTIVNEWRGDIPYGYMIERTEEWGPYRTISFKWYQSGATTMSMLPNVTVDTLTSLGIVNQSEDSYPSNDFFDKKYSYIENSIRTNKYEQIDNSNKLIEFKRGHIEYTSFGRELANCVL